MASLAAVIGASWAGLKAMTATSGPGFSLMQENIGLAAMTETPCVIVNVMRAGPSTGQPTKMGQQDVMQAKWGSHGDYEVIALAPASVQEMFDFTIDAFNYAEQYRCPVVVLADGAIGHMREKLVIPEPEEIEKRLISRKRPRVGPGEYAPFRPDPEDLVPPMACFGEGYRLYATGLTHDEYGRVRTTEPEDHFKLVSRLCRKIRASADKIIRYEGLWLEDADVVVVAYGITSRSARAAVLEAREEGVRAGLLRPITVWPFPSDVMEDAGERAKKVIVAEVNYGQLVREVERWVPRRKVRFLPKLGTFHTPDEILKAIKEEV
ncbi:2-oxoglutarate synthase subunit alpha [Candidatus Bathyarchaeota archaeon ex4484_135]|nr:MAG: 2-oxoglutarate synthase subunit alpha [Candidatus Bathyarchaeota archaeon ex4484_135]